MSDEEEREFTKLVNAIQLMTMRYERNQAVWLASLEQAENELKSFVRSIISERDALRAAMKSHR